MRNHKEIQSFSYDFLMLSHNLSGKPLEQIREKSSSCVPPYKFPPVMRVSMPNPINAVSRSCPVHRSTHRLEPPTQVRGRATEHLTQSRGVGRLVPRQLALKEHKGQNRDLRSNESSPYFFLFF